MDKTIIGLFLILLISISGCEQNTKGVTIVWEEVGLEDYTYFYTPTQAYYKMNDTIPEFEVYADEYIVIAKDECLAKYNTTYLFGTSGERRVIKPHTTILVEGYYPQVFEPTPEETLYNKTVEYLFNVIGKKPMDMRRIGAYTRSLDTLTFPLAGKEVWLEPIYDCEGSGKHFNETISCAGIDGETINITANFELDKEQKNVRNVEIYCYYNNTLLWEKR